LCRVRNDVQESGSKPADLPVEQPTKFKLVIDIATAKVLGIAVAETVIALVDEVRGDHAQG
jgi:putative ABC transport system substrate-binding protein